MLQSLTNTIRYETHENNSINVDSELVSLKSKIESLEREKDKLLRYKQDHRSICICCQQKRDRIKQIESEYIELKNKEREFRVKFVIYKFIKLEISAFLIKPLAKY